MTRSADDRRLVVLQALRAPGADTTYAVHLRDGIGDRAKLRWFSWPEALFGRYDVLHVHWPEYLIRGRGRRSVALNSLRLPLLLARLKLTRTPVVRTLHNPAPHERGTAVERWMLRLVDRATDSVITLNPVTAVPSGMPTRTILHGHYRDQFAPHPKARPVPGRVLYFGLVRPYKGIVRLLGAFAGLDDPALTLRIVGRPNNAQLAASITAAAAADARVSSRLEFVPDGELVTEVGEAELVVLPYSEMHNSGSVLVALSLDRPVLAPRTEATEALRDEVGEWMQLYDGPLEPETLRAALDRVRARGPVDTPALDGRDWHTVGLAHAEVYRDVVSRRARR